MNSTPYPEYTEAIQKYYKRKFHKDVDITRLTAEQIDKSGFWKSSEFQTETMGMPLGFHFGRANNTLAGDNAFRAEPLLSAKDVEDGKTFGHGSRTTPLYRSHTVSRDSIQNEPQTSLRKLPDPPDPIPENMPLTGFQKLAIEEGYADRKTLPHYRKVISGAALNPGHTKGFETRELKAGDDILVYVKNRNVLPTIIGVKAGPSFHDNTRYAIPLGFGEAKVLHFKYKGDFIRYFSIDTDVTLPLTPYDSGSFLVQYEIYSRGYYAKK